MYIQHNSAQTISWHPPRILGVEMRLFHVKHRQEYKRRSKHAYIPATAPKINPLYRKLITDLSSSIYSMQTCIKQHNTHIDWDWTESVYGGNAEEPYISSAQKMERVGMGIFPITVPSLTMHTSNFTSSPSDIYNPYIAHIHRRRVQPSWPTTAPPQTSPPRDDISMRIHMYGRRRSSLPQNASELYTKFLSNDFAASGRDHKFHNFRLTTRCLC